MTERSVLIYRIILVVFWMTMTIGFICDELPAVEALRSPVSLLADAVILVAGAGVMRNRNDIVLAVSFVLLSLVSTVWVNHESLTVWLNGFRFYISLVFMVPLFRYLLSSRYGDYYREQFDKNLKAFLWLQVPCIVFQFLKYGAGDHGGGSFGFGGSGLVSMTIYSVSFYLTMRQWDERCSYIENLYRNRMNLILLLPTFLNETKVSLLLFPVYFILLLPLTLKSAVKHLRYLPLVLILGYGAVHAYGKATGSDTSILFSADFYQHYLIGDHPLDEIEEIAQNCRDGVYESTSVFDVDIPRLAKFAFLPATMNDADGGLPVGAGLGQYKGGTFMGKTRFARDNAWVLEGSVPMLYFIIIEIGLIGAIWFFTDIFLMLGFGKRNGGRNNNIRLMLLAQFCISLLYADVFKYVCFCFPFIYIAMSANTGHTASTES